MSGMGPVWIPFLPPSSNKIYEPVWVQGKPKGKRLTQSARKFKVRAMRVIQQEGRAALLHLKEHIPYELRIAIFFDKAFNKGWPKTDFRYKKVDATNRIKLIEDTAADGVGVDDRHNFRIILEKHCDPDHPGMYVSLVEVPEEEVGLTKEQYDQLQLRRPESVGADSALPRKRDSQSTSRRRPGGTYRSFRRPS
jgi:Holliday junction resolvase RusA-like endonuclease